MKDIREVRVWCGIIRRAWVGVGVGEGKQHGRCEECIGVGGFGVTHGRCGVE